MSFLVAVQNGLISMVFSATPEVYELEYLLEREVYHKYLEFAVIANLKTDKNAK